jgi:hypothetical protein
MFANNTERGIIDGIVSTQIRKIKKVLYSKDWIPVDSATYNLLIEITGVSKIHRFIQPFMN